MQREYRLPDEASPGRADGVLAAAFPEFSRAALQRAFRAGLVRLNGAPASQKVRVRSGDLLVFSLPEAKPSDLRPVAMALEILHEDAHLLVLNKPPGLVVHPGAGTADNTLVHALLAHCAGTLSGIGGVERPGIVHRLDRGTSGAMVVAKSDAAHRALAAQFASRTVLKEYLALVSGVPGLRSGSIRKPIGRNPRQRHKMAVVEEGGREARTDWAAEERFGTLAALIRCTLHSGRTHQIRVHMRSAGHPLLGDSAYGWKPDSRLPLHPPRVMLHAEHLAFTHPVTGRRLDLRASPPADFIELLAALRRATAIERPGSAATRPRSDLAAKKRKRD